MKSTTSESHWRCFLAQICKISPLLYWWNLGQNIERLSKILVGISAGLQFITNILRSIWYVSMAIVPIVFFKIKDNSSQDHIKVDILVYKVPYFPPRQPLTQWYLWKVQLHRAKESYFIYIVCEISDIALTRYKCKKIQMWQSNWFHTSLNIMLI